MRHGDDEKCRPISNCVRWPNCPTIVCIYQIQHNCRCEAGGSDSSQNAERIGINNLQKDYMFARSFFGCTRPMQDCKFKCIWPMTDASKLLHPYLSPSRLKINMWVQSLTCCSNPCYVTQDNF